LTLRASDNSEDDALLDNDSRAIILGDVIVNAKEIAKSGLYLRLQGLSRGESQQLVGRLFGVENSMAVDAELMEKLIELTDGFPLYISLLVQWIKDNENAEIKNGRVVWKGSNTIAETNFPNSVADTISIRLDSLSPITKNVLKVASVIGDDFSARYLTHIIQADLNENQSDMDITEEEVFFALRDAEKNFFLKHQRDKGREESCHIWKWKHDSVTAAIRALIPTARLNELQNLVIFQSAWSSSF